MLIHVEDAVSVAGYAADVAEGGEQLVQPQTTAKMVVLHIRLAQLGVRLPIGRQPDVLTQAASLLDEVHVGHDLGRHLSEPLRVHGSYGHTHEEDEDLEGEREAHKRRLNGAIETQMYQSFTCIHLADAFIQSDFKERALQTCIGH